MVLGLMGIFCITLCHITARMQGMSDVIIIYFMIPVCMIDLVMRD